MNGRPKSDREGEMEGWSLRTGCGRNGNGVTGVRTEGGERR